MDAVTTNDRYPSAGAFASRMSDGVLGAYPRVMRVVATALVQAGGDGDAIVRMVGNKTSRAAFLMGCCAEELVSSGIVMKGREARRYIGEVIEALRPLTHPIRSKRVAPDFRRLLTEYEEHPVRMRVKTIRYMLEMNGLAGEQTILSEDAACQLQIECSVVVDGFTGCLIGMMKPEELASPTPAFTRATKELGPVISETLRRLP